MTENKIFLVLVLSIFITDVQIVQFGLNNCVLYPKLSIKTLQITVRRENNLTHRLGFVILSAMLTPEVWGLSPCSDTGTKKDTPPSVALGLRPSSNVCCLMSSLEKVANKGLGSGFDLLQPADCTLRSGQINTYTHF